MQGSAAVDGEENDNFPLFRVIDGVREREGAIVARVEAGRARLAADTGLAGIALAEALSQELIDDAALRSALIEAAAAFPLSLPLLGPWVSGLVSLGGGVVFQAATEVELVYALGAVWRTRLPPERLRRVAYWLLKLSNFEELSARALAVGVRISVRTLIEKLVSISLSRALLATRTGLLLSRLPSGDRWPLQLAQVAGIPVLAVLGWRSTQGVGRRAVAYFAEEHGVSPGAAR